MSISVGKTVLLQRALRYLAISAFLLVFHLIYSIFSHDVSSPYMTFAFLIPLLGGSIVSLLLLLLPQPNEIMTQVWRMGLSTLVVGFLLRGVFDIYGTEVALVQVFFVLGYGLLLVSFLMYSLFFFRFKRQK